MSIKKRYSIFIIIGAFIGMLLLFIPFTPTDSPYIPPYEPPYDPPDDPPLESEIEVDAHGNVYYIVDGDTYDQNGISGEGNRVRLADIDCPETYESGYQEAKDHLRDLIYNLNVYLDIDDIYGTDYYGRWVGIVYVRHNSTHVLNVNYEMYISGNAVIDDYYNEFNPYNWKMYYYHP